MSIPVYSPSYDNHSLYRFSQYRGRFLDLYVHRKIDPHPLDTIQVLTAQKYHCRPDNFAYDYYGDPDLFWVVPMRNGLKDLLFDFKVGRAFYIPSPSYVSELFS